MSLKLNSSGGGSVTLQEPVTSSNLTLNLPAVNGTVLSTASTFASTGTPAFSATLSANQSIASSSVFTKVPFSVEEIDTASCYDNVTNYRFTPNVAGYYQITFCMVGSQAASSTMTQIAHIYKNGVSVRSVTTSSVSGNYVSATNTALVYMNGTTDYVEAYTWATLASLVYSGSSFSGYMVRSP